MNAFKQIIKASGMSVPAAAELAGVRASTLYRHLHGQRAISAASALLYARAFGVPLEAILGHGARG